MSDCGAVPKLNVLIHALVRLYQTMILMRTPNSKACGCVERPFSFIKFAHTSRYLNQGRKVMFMDTFGMDFTTYIFHRNLYFMWLTRAPACV